MKLLVATQNKGKQQESIRLLRRPGLKVIFPSDIAQIKDLDVEESGETVEENSFLKASQFATKAKMIAVADDSCLNVEALDGAPGIHSKRFFSGTWQDRNQEILRRLKNKSNRSAQFVSCLCLVNPKKIDQPKYFKGVVKGDIGQSSKGNEGFEYDLIFIPEGYDQTFAQLGNKVKNKISHRFKAFKKLKAYLDQEYA